MQPDCPRKGLSVVPCDSLSPVDQTFLRDKHTESGPVSVRFASCYSMSLISSYVCSIALFSQVFDQSWRGQAFVSWPGYPTVGGVGGPCLPFFSFCKCAFAKATLPPPPPGEGVGQRWVRDVFFFQHRLRTMRYLLWSVCPMLKGVDLGLTR